MIVSDAPKYSIHNKRELSESSLAGCYYCMKIFKADTVIEFLKDENTGICPECGVDSVLGDKSGYEINPEVLLRLNKYWFR